MHTVVIPNVLIDTINAAIDSALAGRPCDEASREYIFYSLLDHYDEHGVIPDFSLEAKAEAQP